jgi:hypothetical protein
MQGTCFGFAFHFVGAKLGNQNRFLKTSIPVDK